MTAEPLKPLQPRPYILPDFDHSDEIKRCPCCNGVGRVFVEDPKKGYSIFCHECGLMTPFLPIEHAIAAWNRRAEPEELPEWLIDELINGLVLAKDDKTEGWNDALEWVLSLKKEDK